MENKIDKIITLDNNLKYMYLDQGVYNGKNYFLASLLGNDNLPTKEITIFEETIMGKTSFVSTIKDEKIYNLLIEYFRKRIS